MKRYQRACLGALGVFLLICLGVLLQRDAAEAGPTLGAPSLASPADNALLGSFGTTLSWANPVGTTQVHLQLIPINNDGPGVDLHIGLAQSSYQIPPPPQWYGLLPDMTYTWRVSVSNATTFVEVNDPSWGPWAERRFRTPKVSGSGILAAAPTTGFAVNTLTPTLQWTDLRKDVFYYEVRLSEDSTFNTDPATATAMVYTSLLHGGVASPQNSYAVPASAPLRDATRYYWQVRPRVQGDGTPAAWSQTFSFVTAASTESPPWLTQVNLYRALTNLPPLIENPTWSENCAVHARYMVQNDYIGHSEDPDNSWYTPEGNSCGTSGNVFGSTSAGTTDETAVDFWMAGPFHAVGIIDPRLRQVGFGSDGDDAGRVRRAAALDILHGLDRNAASSTTYPIIWPADGAAVPLRSYRGGESPDPLTSCPDYAAPAGLPLILQLSAGQVVPAVTASSFSSGEQPLEHCVYDGTNYMNPDSPTQSLGRAVLQSRSAIVIVPRSPLAAGGSYTVSITTNDKTYTWSFSASE